MPRYHVFLNAPSPRDLNAASTSQDGATSLGWRWQTVTLGDPQDAMDLDQSEEQPSLPSADFEAASRRISRFYENIIFKNNLEDGEEQYPTELSSGEEDRPPGNTQEYTAYITWLPTTAGDRTRPSQSAFISRRDSTFLRGLDSRIHGAETQETQETASYSEAGGGASDTSIARFPQYHFSLHSLSSLSVLGRSTPPAARVKAAYELAYPFQGNRQKVNLLVAVMEVEGPDTIHLKKGPDAGKEVSLLKIIIGDEDGGVCRLTAWREVAEQWGGSYADTPAPSLKRGDVVYLQNILVAKDASPLAAGSSTTTSSVSLTASPALSSAMSICYRTMPVGDKAVDSKLRPDLRLGYSDAAVRKVAAVVRWFQGIAGLPLL